MFDLARKHAALALAAIAFVLSACNTFTDLRPLPNPYQGSETVADRALVTLKAFGAAQAAIETTCAPAEPGTDLAAVCVPLIEAEQRVRPGATAAGQLAEEYADIDKRIRELGPDAPAEWLLAAAEIAGRLSLAWEPIEADVRALIGKAGDVK